MLSSEQSQALSRPLKRYGSELPRIWTPPLRPLTPETSLGFSCIDFADHILPEEIDLLPWQRWLLIHALELLPDGSPRFRNVIVLVARQNGKSTLSQVLALWVMYVLGRGLVLGTAQDLDVAEEIWQGAVDLVEETPDLDALKDRVIKVNGKKSLLLKTGERYKVKAASRRGGRGLSGDLILLDELREHQTWDAWAAITKTTMAREQAQVWALSNAGDASSIVLRYLRKMAHAALGDPDGINRAEDPNALLHDVDPDSVEIDDDDNSLGIFEWSAKPNADLSDRDSWADANPALGYLISERSVASARRTDPEWVFRTEVLCQWSDGTLEGPFPPGSWESGIDDGSRIADGNRIAVAIDMSWDRSSTSVAVAGLRSDGKVHVGIIAVRAGTDWLARYLLSAEAPPLSGVALQSRGAPVSGLVESLEAAGIAVVPWHGSDVGAATGAFYDLVRQGELRHRTQPVLDVPAGTALIRPVGDAWTWDRKRSACDISPLIAATAAVWLLSVDKGPAISKYETDGLVVV